MKNGRTEGGTLISQVHQVSQRVWYEVLNRNGLTDLAGARGRVIFALWNEDNIPIKKLVEKTRTAKISRTRIVIFLSIISSSIIICPNHRRNPVTVYRFQI